jgi:hypothetical protein
MANWITSESPTYRELAGSINTMLTAWPHSPSPPVVITQVAISCLDRARSSLKTPEDRAVSMLLASYGLDIFAERKFAYADGGIR